MSYIKSLRQQCYNLNLAHSADGSRVKPYVVMSEKLMKRNASGKLQFYKELKFC